MHPVWTLASYLLFWAALPVLALHPKLRGHLRARLGWHPRGWPGLPEGRRRIWLHGASAGDVAALVPLARALRAAHPEISLIASTITNSGHAIAAQHGDLFDVVTALPFDLPGAVRRTLERLRPDALVLEYTELWPRLVREASARGAAVVLHNGRFSAARLGRYRWLFRFTGNLLRDLRLLLMRDEAEAERAAALGAGPERLRVTGNTKLDNVEVEVDDGVVSELRRVAGFADGDRIWVAGSTHDPEEDLLLSVMRRLRAGYPRLRLVLAPRYIERAERALHVARRRGFTARLRSRGADDDGPVDVLVLDTIGELRSAYALGELVFVGGSFARRGGHNILEPAACGKPVLFGPHMENVGDAVQLLLGRGGVQVADALGLERAVHDLLGDDDTRRELGELAAASVRRARGAAEKNAAAIWEVLAPSDSLPPG